MNPVKKLEIIIDHLALSVLLDRLEQIGVKDYTLIRDVEGRGHRGRMAGDGLSGEFSNCYLIIAVSPAVAEQIVDQIRPILREQGGVCLVSDALWVKH
ncbi:MAG: transcriptional regulator [Verrucomicrobiota bacterium]